MTKSFMQWNAEECLFTLNREVSVLERASLPSLLARGIHTSLQALFLLAYGNEELICVCKKQTASQVPV